MKRIDILSILAFMAFVIIMQSSTIAILAQKQSKLEIVKGAQADSTIKSIYYPNGAVLLYSKEYFKFDKNGYLISDSILARDTSNHSSSLWSNSYSDYYQYKYDANGNQLLNNYWTYSNNSVSFTIYFSDTSKYDNYNHRYYEGHGQRVNGDSKLHPAYQRFFYSFLHNNTMIDTLVLETNYDSLTNREHLSYDNQWRLVTNIDSGYNNSTSWILIYSSSDKYIHSSLSDTIYNNSVGMESNYMQLVTVKNSSGQRIAYINNNWDGGNLYTPYYKTEYQYNDNGDITVYHYYVYGSSSYQSSPLPHGFSDCAIDSNWYDNNHHDTLEIKYQGSGTNIVPWHKIKTSFNSSGGNLEQITYLWDGTKFVLSAIQYWYYPKSINYVPQFNEKANFSIYPNPAESYLIINLQQSNKGMYDIYNLTGQRIASGELSKGENQVGLNGYSKGVYFVHVKTMDGKFTTKKLILN